MERPRTVSLELPSDVSLQIRQLFELQLDHIRVLETENRETRRLLSDVTAKLDALMAPHPAALPVPSEQWKRVPKPVREAWDKQGVRVRALELKVAELQKEVESLRRASKRQAAPFSKGEPKANPKRPGRPKEHPPSWRPRPDDVDETIELKLDRCPHCENPVTADRRDEQFVEDIPEDVRAWVTRFLIDSAWCRHCRRRVRPPAHPAQVSQAMGAAQAQLGPRIIGLAADWKHRLGIPYRKSVDLLQKLFKVKVSAGGLVQATARLSDRLAPVEKQIQDALQQSAVVQSDETGWRICGLLSWLWVFTNPHFTLYVIRRGRGHQIVLDTLGAAFKGVLLTDCLGTYDAAELDSYDKAKCLAHFLVDMSEATELYKDEGLVFVPKAKELLKDVLALKASQPKLSPDDYKTLVDWAELMLNVMLDMPYTHPADIRLANRCRKQRPYMFTFLYQEEVDGTNNRSERQLKPSIIVRKISAGNRTEKGAETHARLASVLATYAQQGIPFMEVVRAVMLPFANLPLPVLPFGPIESAPILPRRDYPELPLQKVPDEPHPTVPSPFVSKKARPRGQQSRKGADATDAPPTQTASTGSKSPSQSAATTDVKAHGAAESHPASTPVSNPRTQRPARPDKGATSADGGAPAETPPEGLSFSTESKATDARPSGATQFPASTNVSHAAIESKTGSPSWSSAGGRFVTFVVSFATTVCQWAPCPLLPIGPPQSTQPQHNRAGRTSPRRSMPAHAIQDISPGFQRGP